LLTFELFDVAIELQKTILLETLKAAAIYKKKKVSFLIKKKVSKKTIKTY